MKYILFTVLALVILPVRAHAGLGTPPELPDEFKSALENASDVTLYSLQPNVGADLPEWDFHDQHILGKVELKQDKAKEAIAALNAAVSEGATGMMSMCMFYPRHAIRVTSAGNTYDAVICYECGQLELLKNDKPLEFSGMIGGNDKALNQLLSDAGIPLADDKAALERSFREEAKVALERAKQGDTKVWENLGKYYLSGRGVDRNLDEGSKWLAKAYEMPADSPDFKVKLGRLLHNRMDVQSDYAAAAKLFREAADAGNAEGQYKYGYMLQIGQGVEENDAEALEWYRRSADQGNPKAQYEVGLSYVRDWRTKPVSPEGKKWFLKAAEQGHPEAMSWLGGVYENGLGVEKDAEESHFWYQLAKRYYSSHGGQKPEVSQQIKQAVEKRVTEWVATHPPCPENCHD